MTEINEPNPYLKNIHINPESKLSVFIATMRFTLVMAGIIGVSIEMFKENGWLSRLFDYVTSSASTLLWLPVLIFFSWLCNGWLSSGRRARLKKSGDIPMYAMMAYGIYYLVRLFVIDAT